MYSVLHVNFWVEDRVHVFALLIPLKYCKFTALLERNIADHAHPNRAPIPNAPIIPAIELHL